MSADNKRIDKYYKKKAAERRAAAEEAADPEVKTLNLAAIDWHRGTRVCAVATVVVFASYLAALWNGYVYCDMFNLTPFRTVTRDWGGELLYLFYDALIKPLSQPLVRASYATDIAFGTISSPAVFHGDSLCLHLANCIVLFILTVKIANLHNQQKKRLEVDPYVVGAGATLLLACHPLASEAVTYIAARSALLVTLNYFLALLCFLRGFHAKKSQIKEALLGYGFCYFFILMGIWSGPQALTAAGAMIALALMIKPKDETTKRWLTSRPLELFSILLLAVVVPFVLLIKYEAPIGNGFGLEVLPTVQYIATQCKLLVVYYLRVLFVPYGLSLDPPYGMATGFSDPLAIVGALIPFGILALAWRFRANLLIAWPLVLFVLSLLPDFILPQPEVMSDRRMYLPLAALSIPFGYLIAKISEKKVALTLMACSFVLFAFIGLTNLRIYQWKSDDRIWADTYSMNKGSERSRVMRVWALSRGHIDQAGKLAVEEIKTYPNSALLLMVLGKVHNVDKQYSKAKDYFKKALALAEKQNLSEEVVWELQYGMAYASLQNGDMKAAKEYADKALEAQPNNAVLHLIRGEYYMTEDQPQAALVELNKAHTLDRYNPDILAPLARAALGCGTKEYQDLGYQAALMAARIANDSKLDLLKAYGALETGRVHEAMMYLDTYRKQNPNTPEMYYILYGILKQLGDDENARKALKVATTADPKITKKIRLYLNRPVVVPQGVDAKPKPGEKATNPAPTPVPTKPPSASAPTATPAPAKTK